MNFYGKVRMNLQLTSCGCIMEKSTV